MKDILVNGFFSFVLATAAAGCLAAAAGAGAEAGYIFTQEDRSPEETLNDQRITASIKTKLLADPQVSGLDINVDTFKSVVLLRGFVDNEEETERAVQLARSVPGVADVKTKLILK